MHANLRLSCSSRRGDVGRKGVRSRAVSILQRFYDGPSPITASPRSHARSHILAARAINCYSTIWLSTSNPTTKLLMDDTQLSSDLPMTHIAPNELSPMCLDNIATRLVERSHENVLCMKPVLRHLVWRLKPGITDSFPSSVFGA